MHPRSRFRPISQVAAALGGTQTVCFGPFLPSDFVRSITLALGCSRIALPTSLDGVAGLAWAYNERVITFASVWMEEPLGPTASITSLVLHGLGKSLFRSTTFSSGLEIMSIPYGEVISVQKMPLNVVPEGRWLAMNFSPGSGGTGDVAVSNAVIGWCGVEVESWDDAEGRALLRGVHPR